MEWTHVVITFVSPVALAKYYLRNHALLYIISFGNTMTSSRVYIGRLAYDIRERDIEKFFKGFGKIREILIKNGFGFVEFDDYRDADDAVYELNGKDLLGERVTIEHAKGSPRGNDMYRDRNRGYRAPPPRRSRMGGGGGRDSRYGPPTRTEYRLIVENLSSRVSWQDLKDYMRSAGEVTYADAHKQRRNEGVVEFASFSDMKNAIDKLDDTDLSGRRIKLVEDRSRGGRRKSRSRSRDSRSRSRSSRSKSRSRSRRRDSRSRSASRSRSKSKTRNTKSSRSRSHSRNNKASNSRSRSPHNRKNNKSRSRSKSQEHKSHSKTHRSQSRSKSPRKSMSRSKSPRKSLSRSRSKSFEKGSVSPVAKDEPMSSAD